MNKPPPFTGYDPDKKESADVDKPDDASQYLMNEQQTRSYVWFAPSLLPWVLAYNVFKALRVLSGRDYVELRGFVLGLIVPVICMAVIIVLFEGGPHIQWWHRVISGTSSCWLFVLLIRSRDDGFLHRFFSNGKSYHPVSLVLGGLLFGLIGVVCVFVVSDSGGGNFIKAMFASGIGFSISGAFFKSAFAAKVKGSK